MWLDERPKSWCLFLQHATDAIYVDSFECEVSFFKVLHDILAIMAKNISKTKFTLDEVLEAVVVSDSEFSSSSEYGDLSSSEEENIDEGFDPIVDHEDAEPSTRFVGFFLDSRQDIFTNFDFHLN